MACKVLRAVIIACVTVSLLLCDIEAVTIRKGLIKNDSSHSRTLLQAAGLAPKVSFVLKPGWSCSGNVLNSAPADNAARCTASCLETSNCIAAVTPLGLAGGLNFICTQLASTAACVRDPTAKTYIKVASPSFQLLAAGASFTNSLSASVPASNPLDCSNRCSAQPACIGFVMTGDSCSLKSADAFAYAARVADDESDTYIFTDDRFVAAADVALTGDVEDEAYGRTSTADCTTRCFAFSWCVGFNYFSWTPGVAPSACKLFKTVDGISTVQPSTTAGPAVTIAFLLKPGVTRGPQKA